MTDTRRFCRWWSKGHIFPFETETWRESAVHDGSCHKASPVAFTKERQGIYAPLIETVWPRTWPDDFCGDFQRYK